MLLAITWMESVKFNVVSNMVSIPHDRNLSNNRSTYLKIFQVVRIVFLKSKYRGIVLKNVIRPILGDEQFFCHKKRILRDSLLSSLLWRRFFFSSLLSWKILFSDLKWGFLCCITYLNKTCSVKFVKNWSRINLTNGVWSSCGNWYWLWAFKTL